ncbi:MAG: molybdopterin-dependent oxidoreductase, partial [Actinobacteria bacterium]|nr:molybdopterin-dependent oxidoreductase [Actinomycetota bacterium]
MTNHWRDFKNSDVILVIGANPAENHPCGWKWPHVGRDERGTKIIHVDPRFTRTSAIADVFVPIRAGADTAFFGGLINYVLEHELYQEDYVKLHTNASFIVAEGFSFDDGLFSGYDVAERTYDTTTWDYERDGEGFAQVDPTLRDPRCVFQLMREHYRRYTPEMISKITGIPEEKFVAVAAEFGA